MEESARLVLNRINDSSVLVDVSFLNCDFNRLLFNDHFSDFVHHDKANRRFAGVEIYQVSAGAIMVGQGNRLVVRIVVAYERHVYLEEVNNKIGD